MKNTDLIDRYLQAVKFWLPKDQKRDIVQELSEDLRLQIEEKEALLGYELNEDEIAGFLKRRGRPIVVASRYFPQRHLIGPVLFPFYSFVLKMAALGYFLPWVLVWAGLMIFNRQYRTQHAGVQLLGDWAWFWQLVILVFTLITITFALLERVQAARSKLFDEWNPRNLPKVRQQRKLSPRVRNFVELFFNANFIVWWLAVGHYPHTLFPITDWFRPAAGLGVYYWPILGVLLATLAQQITNAFRPELTWLRPATLLATNAALLVMVALMLRIQPLVLLQGQYSQVDRYVKAVGIANMVVFWTLVGIAVGALITCCVNAYQIAQHLRARQTRLGSPAMLHIL